MNLLMGYLYKTLHAGSYYIEELNNGDGGGGGGGGGGGMKYAETAG
jgi:hypothetical protein